MDDWRKQRDLLLEETMVFAQSVRTNGPKTFGFIQYCCATHIDRRCNTLRTFATAKADRSRDVRRRTRVD